MTTYSPPIELRPVCSIEQKSPRIDKLPISFGDISPSTPFDIRSMPPEKSSTFSTTSPNQQLTSSLSISSDKLISLDTPQQTPTAINPPLLFDLSASKDHLSNSINDQFIDGNGNGSGNDHIDKTNSNNNHSNNTSNGKDLCVILIMLKNY